MSDNLNYNNCMVSGCRFPTYHVTAGHNCGSCKKYGHGIIECTNSIKKDLLVNYMSDVLPLSKQCKFGECKYKHLHTSEAHHCTLCQNRMHSLTTCPKNSNNQVEKKINIQCPLCKKSNQINKKQQKIYGLSDTCVVCLGNNVEVFFPECRHVCICIGCFNKLTNQDKIDVFNDIRDETLLSKQKYDLVKIKTNLKEYPSYTLVYEGMGCYTLIRRLNPGSQLEGMFNHSDDFHCPDKIKKLDEFINGYCFVESNSMFHEWLGNSSYDN